MGYALLHVLVDVEAVVAVLAKGLVPEDVKAAAAAALEDVQEVVIPAVRVLVTEGVQEVVPVLVLLVLTVVLITAQVVAVHCAKVNARDAPVDVQGLVNHLVQVSVKDVQEVAWVIVVANVQEDAEEVAQDVVEDLVQLVFIVTPLAKVINNEKLMEET